jgi:hypothetical protein
MITIYIYNLINLVYKYNHYSNHMIEIIFCLELKCGTLYSTVQYIYDIPHRFSGGVYRLSLIFNVIPTSHLGK